MQIDGVVVPWLTQNSAGTINSQTPFNDVPKVHARITEDFIYRVVGQGAHGFTSGTSFSGGPTGTAQLANPLDTRGFGFLRLQYTGFTGAGAQSAAAHGGFVSLNRPVRLDKDCEYYFQTALIVNNIALGSGTTAYFFIGLDDLTSITAGHTNAIGFKYEYNSSFSGDRYRFDPVCRTAGVQSKIVNTESILLYTTEVLGAVYKVFRWWLYNDGSQWVCKFYKQPSLGNTPGADNGMGWIDLGEITSNVPESANLQPTCHAILSSSTPGTTGGIDMYIDYVDLRIVRKTKRYT